MALTFGSIALGYRTGNEREGSRTRFEFSVLESPRNFGRRLSTNAAVNDDVSVYWRILRTRCVVESDVLCQPQWTC